MLALSALLPVLLFAGIAWSERTRTLQDAERDAVRTVWALHEHAAKVLETHELVLADVARQVRGRTWEELERDEGLRGHLLRVAADLDQVANILLADETGRIRLLTVTEPLPVGATVADREFFAFHRDGGTGTHIDPARIGPDGQRTFTVSRRLRLATEGGAETIGVAAIITPTEHFTTFWQRFAPTVAHVIPLVRSDGHVIERHPAPETPQRLNVRGPFLSRALAQREGVYTAVSQVDGVERINAFTRVKDYPLHISFSVETRAVLAEWQERMGVLGLFSVLAALALLVATGFAMRQQRQQMAAARRWQETADRLTAEMAAREQAEASLRRAQTLNAVGQLTAGVAHDFNNLLQAIRGGFTLLRKPRTPEAAESLIASGLQAVDRGAKLVRQLMVFARREKLGHSR
jgi:hypothetical protein